MNDLKTSAEPMESKIRKIFLHFRPFYVTLILLFFCQLFFMEVAAFTQDSARHVVNVKRSWAKGGDYIHRVPGKDLVFFMGDSKIVAGIIPEEFDRASGGKTYSYNVALPGLPLAPHYFWLKDYLASHEPEDYPDYIVLSLKKAGWDFFHFANYSIQQASFPEMFEYFGTTGNPQMLVNYFLPIRFHWPLMKRYFIGKVYRMAPQPIKDKIKDKYYEKQMGRETYDHNWQYFFETQFVKPRERWIERSKYLAFSRGHYDFREAAAQGGILPDNYRYVKKGDWGEASDELDDPFIRRFFRLTREHGIKVVLINDYILPSQIEAEQDRGVPGLWQKVAERYDNVILSPEAGSKTVYPNRLFSDPLHLTVQGAVFFSRHVAGAFRQAVGAGS